MFQKSQNMNFVIMLLEFKKFTIDIFLMIVVHAVTNHEINKF